MANIEMDTLMRRKNKNGDIETHYPITRAENVLELEERIQEVSNSEQTQEKLTDISVGIKNLEEKLDENISSRAPSETALNSEIWTDVRAKRIDLLEEISAEVEKISENASEVKNFADDKISSRAPADTALSNKTWTDERAKSLDIINPLLSRIEALENAVKEIEMINNIKGLMGDSNPTEAGTNTVMNYLKKLDGQKYELVGVPEETEVYKANTPSVTFTTTTASNAGSRTTIFVRFVPKYNGTIAVKFEGSIKTTNTTTTSSPGGVLAQNTIAGLIYSKSLSGKIGIRRELFEETTLVNKGYAPAFYEMPAVVPYVLVSGNIPASSTATMSLKEEWYYFPVTAGEEYFLGVGAYAHVSGSSSFDLSSTNVFRDAGVAIGYAAERRD